MESEGSLPCSQQLATGLYPDPSAVGIATGCGLDGPGVGVRVPVGSRILSSPRRSDWFWDPPNLFSGYRGLFPQG
jgi:hypothetical protein